MIQDIGPLKLDNGWLPDASPTPDSTVFFFNGDEVLHASSDDTARFPGYGELDGIAAGDLVYLFSIGDETFFLYQGDALNDAALPPSYGYASLRSLRRRGINPKHHVFAAFTAFHLYTWYSGARYCGRCSGETVNATDERARVCPSCELRIYPRINPAVIVAVTNGDKLLMTRYANRPIKVHALIAGFNEIGETLEQTVEREVMEETGLKVKNIRYYKSQPWGIAGDILAGYFCELDGDDTIHKDDKELKEAAWFKRDEIEGQGDDFSLTNEMMMVFKKGVPDG